MSTRIHQKVPLTFPLNYVAESITRIPPESKITIRSRQGMLLYFLGGEALLSLNGEPASRVGEGSVVIAPGPGARVYSSVSKSASPLHFYGIGFVQNARLPNAGAAPHQKEMVSIIKRAFSRPAIISDGNNVTLRQCLLALRHAFDDQNVGGSTLLYTAALNICVETARLILTHQSWHQTGPGRRKSRSLVNAALEYMLRNLKHNPNIESIAWSVKVTSEHLCRVFRKETGRTPREALRGMQIDMAKSLLINSPLEIHHVAEQSGFSSATAFGRYFKSASGMTPTEYRATHAGNFHQTLESPPPTVDLPNSGSKMDYSPRILTKTRFLRRPSNSP